MQNARMVEVAVSSSRTGWHKRHWRKCHLLRHTVHCKVHGTACNCFSVRVQQIRIVESISVGILLTHVLHKCGRFAAKCIFDTTACSVGVEPIVANFTDHKRLCAGICDGRCCTTYSGSRRSGRGGFGNQLAWITNGLSPLISCGYSQLSEKAFRIVGRIVTCVL